MTGLDEIERPFLRATPKTDDRADTQPRMDTQIKQPIRLARIEKSSATSARPTDRMKIVFLPRAVLYVLKK